MVKNDDGSGGTSSHISDGMAHVGMATLQIRMLVCIVGYIASHILIFGFHTNPGNGKSSHQMHTIYEITSFRNILSDSIT